MTDSAETMRERAGRMFQEWVKLAPGVCEFDELMTRFASSEIIAALSASGTKSDGTTEGRGRYAEQPGSALSCAAPRNGGAPPTEAVAGIKPGPSDPISSQPDEREAIAEQLQGWADFIDTEAAQSMSVASAAYANGGSLADDLRSAILAMQAERRGEQIELAYGLLWVVGSDRSTTHGNALYHARKALFERLDKAGQSRGISAARKLLDDDSATPGFFRNAPDPLDPAAAHPAPIARLEPTAWQLRYADTNHPWVNAEKANTGSYIEWRPLVPVEQAEAHAAEQVRPLVEVLEGLIEAVELDANEGLKGISGYTGARLNDAKNAIRARRQV